MRKLFAALCVVATALVAQAQAQPGRPTQSQVNSRYVQSQDSLEFVTSGVRRDTLIDATSSDSTRTFSLSGVDAAVLYLLSYTEETDQTDTVEVNLVYTVKDTGNVSRWSAKVIVDTVLVTSADGSYELDMLDLTAAAVTTNIGIPINELGDIRLIFDSIGLASDDTIEVAPILLKRWDKDRN